MEKNKIYLYKVEHAENRGIYYTFCSYKPIEQGQIVICRTCYGRSIGIVVGEATINDIVDFTGLKPCGLANRRQLLQAGWKECPDGFWQDPYCDVDEEEYGYDC